MDENQENLTKKEKKSLMILEKIGGIDALMQSGGRLQKNMSVADSSLIIDAFGGTNRLARICNSTSASVANWRKTGIPAWRELYLRQLAPQLFSGKAHPHV